MPRVRSRIRWPSGPRRAAACARERERERERSRPGRVQHLRRILRRPRRSLLLDIAGRYDRSDYDDTLAGKAAIRWEFLPNVALRASVSNSYRAPSLVQVGFATSSTSFGAGGQLTSVGTLSVDDPLARALGAQDLDAEKALAYSAGFTATLPGAFTFSVDAYQIDVDDRITLSEHIDASSAPASVQPIFAAATSRRRISSPTPSTPRPKASTSSSRTASAGCWAGN